MMRRICRTLVCLTTAFSVGAVVRAQFGAENVVPHVDLVTFDLVTGNARAYFGYMNSNGSVTNLVIGTSNFFSPGNSNRGQPRAFQPGEHHSVFSVSFLTYPTLTWNLGTSSATAAIADAVATVGQTGEYLHDREGVYLAYEGLADTWLHHVGSTLTVGKATIFNGAILEEDSGEFVSTVFTNEAGGITRVKDGILRATTSFHNAGLLELDGGVFETPWLENLGGGIVRLTGGENLLPENFTNAGTLHGVGGSVVRETFANASGGTVEWEAGDFTADTLINAGTLVVSGGNVEVNEGFTNHGSLRLAGGVLSVAAFAHDGFIDWRGGTLELTSGDLTTDAEGPLGANPVLGDGTLRLVSGATHNAAGRTLVLNPGAELITQGGSNAGTLVVTLAKLTSESGTFVNEAGATLSATGAMLTFTGDGETNDDGLKNYGTLNLIDTVVAGDVHSPAGSTVNVASGVTFTGYFSGGASFTGGGLATFAGGYSPGDSPALVTHAGGLTLLSTNILIMEIAGDGIESRGTLYDAIDIAGTFTPGGTLHLRFIDGFNPFGGERFVLFNFGSIDGQFDAFDFPTLSASLTWDTSLLYIDGSIGINAIPEPATWAVLVGFATLGFALHRRRSARKTNSVTQR